MPLEQPGKYRAGLSLQELSAMMHNSDLGQMQPNVSGAKKKGKKAPALTQLLSFSFFFFLHKYCCRERNREALFSRLAARLATAAQVRMEWSMRGMSRRGIQRPARQ